MDYTEALRFNVLWVATRMCQQRCYKKYEVNSKSSIPGFVSLRENFYMFVCLFSAHL